MSVRGRDLPGDRPSAPEREPTSAPGREWISAPEREPIPAPVGRPASAPGRQWISVPVFTHVTGVTTRFTNKLPTFWNDRVHILSDIETDGQ